MPKVKEIFEKQLEKCQVEYFDFYLFHNLCEMNVDAYLDDEKYGIYTYLMEQKKNGRIRHLGFFCPRSYDVMKRFLDAYGRDMEFCQIQLNWIDYDFQDAKGKIDLLNEYQIPIWVMEPLRGGKLAALGEKYEKQLKELRPQETIPAWSFRFLQTIPHVTMILSGMSSEEQLKANLETFRTEEPLNDAEWKTLLSMAEDMTKNNTVPCTACHYCTSHCPQELDIPHAAESLQRACVYRRRLYCSDGIERDPAGQTAHGLYRVQELRGSLSAADPYLGGYGGLLKETAGIRTITDTDSKNGRSGQPVLRLAAFSFGDRSCRAAGARRQAFVKIRTVLGADTIYCIYYGKNILYIDFPGAAPL